jgi:methylenetetrahydrofolate--tRNA-(uracil-5-)-methyltransferase
LQTPAPSLTPGSSDSVRELLRSSDAEVVVVGAGLAGSECAWQLASLGHKVLLIEQRPEKTTRAHTGPLFAELVCSNSLKSKDPLSAPGLLKQELNRIQSLILKAAAESEVPAGQALGVDREIFSKIITDTLTRHPQVQVVRGELSDYKEALLGPGTLSERRPVVFATGPLTSDSLAASLVPLVGTNLYFYDAIAPIVAADSIDMGIAYRKNRYDKELQHPEGDYINCPFSESQYMAFIEALACAEKVQVHDFEKSVYFQACQPIEAILEKGKMSLAFGPMKPVGLEDPKTGKIPFAALQLRAEDREGRAWSMVGFQTKLKYPEQQRIFRMIPGLEKAEFYRLGSLHRNTYIQSPALLDNNLRLKTDTRIRFAGQITGVEGYLESTAIGALVGRLVSLELRGGQNLPPPPSTTALGALAAHVYQGRIKDFQPMNINWGLVPLNGIEERDKNKKEKMVTRAERQFGHWLSLF